MTFKQSGLYTDLYQLAMCQAYYFHQSHQEQVVFDYYYRKIPFKGGYVIFAGLQDLLDSLADFSFSANDLAYLAQQGFKPAFLEVLKDFKFTGSISAVREGELVFPNTPILRIESTMLEAQLIETMLLNILNFQSLIATKAGRVRSIAPDKNLSEFGLRRAQGLGGIAASRATIIGGFDSTSNVYAAQHYQLKCVGTMAHSFVQMYDDELTAFRKFAEANPKNCILLVDTYNTLKSGIPNAIKVALEMRARGEELFGIRLDSGDLSYLSQKTRKLLDEADLTSVKIAVSNQLDEYVIRSLIHQGAPIDIFGVGTNLVTGQPDSALGGVYKLAEVNGQARIKISDNVEKTTLPCKKQVYRLLNEDGTLRGADAIGLADQPVPSMIIDPHNPHKQMSCKPFKAVPLLQIVYQNEQQVSKQHTVDEIKTYASNQLKKLPKEYKRFENPHQYKVGISPELKVIRDELYTKHYTL